jgi:hypothetical protein
MPSKEAIKEAAAIFAQWLQESSEGAVASEAA